MYVEGVELVQSHSVCAASAVTQCLCRESSSWSVSPEEERGTSEGMLAAKELATLVTPSAFITKSPFLVRARGRDI